MAMDNAAANGHLRVVQWLHTNRTEGCTVLAMDEAAKAGHLEVVQWLHSNRSEGCTVRAMSGAAFGGHFHVLEFLRVHRQEGCGPVTHVICAATDKLEVLKWIHCHYPFLFVIVGAASREARHNRHLHIVQWLNEFQTGA